MQPQRTICVYIHSGRPFDSNSEVVGIHLVIQFRTWLHPDLPDWDGGAEETADLRGAG